LAAFFIFHKGVFMRALVVMALCISGGLMLAAKQEVKAAGPPEKAPVQAVMPRQYITPTMAQLEVGERGWINCKALVVDDKHRCWLLKAAHVHDTPADAGSSVEVARTNSGWKVSLHQDYKWKTLPEAGLAADCFPVETLIVVSKKQAKR
jgi:hypothetical protein